MPKGTIRILALTGVMVAMLAPTAMAEKWGNARKSCNGRTLNVSAQLMDIPWGASWENACATKSGHGVGYGITRKADRCVKSAGMWGEWSIPDHAQCAPKYEWAEVNETCTGNGVQTISSKLYNIPFGESWEDACNAMNASGAVAQKGVSGTPERCVSTVAGVYGEWDKQDVASCVSNLEWGSFKDEGCVKDAEGVAAAGTGVTGEGYRVWASVLWNINGDWMEACRIAPINETLPNGQVVNMPYPTACTIAEADEALSWVTGAVLGAGTAFIAAPTGPYAIAAAGVALAVGQKGSEELIFNYTDTGMNVWGFVWVEDQTCGVVDRTDFPANEDASYTPLSAQTSGAVEACPQNATAISGTLTCSCSSALLGQGSVWGSDIYTADSSICKSALHNGQITRAGGIVRLRLMSGQAHYSGSTSHGVTTKSYGKWDKSFRFD